MYVPSWVSDDQSPKNLYDEILPGLFQGGTPDEDWRADAFESGVPQDAPAVHFDAVVTLFAWAQPCDWEVEWGSATVVRTFHKQEHGLRLADGARVRRTLPQLALDHSGGLHTRVELLARCDATTGIRIQLETGTATGIATIELAGTLAPASGLGGDWLTRFAVPLTGTGASEAAFAESLSLELTGEGACLVDEISLQSGPYEDCEDERWWR